jgi:hypothetical protein
METEEQQIDEEFSHLIREQLSDEQFWKYIRYWKDGDSLIEEMEEWDTETKKEAIKEIKEIMKK